MKITPNTVTKSTNRPRSFRAIFGSKEARRYGLTDDQGNLREIICINASGTVMLAPVLQTLQTLTYRSFTTTVCTNGKFFFGRITPSSEYLSWYTSSIEKIEIIFKKAVDDNFP